MQQELYRFEKRMKEALNEFQTPPEERKHKRREKPSVNRKGFLIHLAVRHKRLAADEIYTYFSEKLSRLEAIIDAERAARKAGYPIIGHMIDIKWTEKDKLEDNKAASV